MALSRKVDLTAESDFSNNLPRQLALSRAVIDLANDINYDIVTPGEYDILKLQEQFFGSNLLINQANLIFYSDKEKRFNEEIRTHCQCCGIEIRIPWKNKGGLCERCDYIVEREYKVPWKIHSETKERNTAMDVFSLR